eukprot:15460111-Alexandrium_andersonii.AAC.1
MGMYLGYPVPPENPHVEAHQVGDHSERSAGDQPNRDPGVENRRIRAGRDWGRLAMLGLVISAVGLRHA